MTKIDITGKRYGHLTAIRYDHTTKSRHEYWLFKCDCGKEKVIEKYSVTSGVQKYCGCQKWKQKHGKSHERIYSIWHCMIQRCENKHNTGYKNYGGRGINVCKEWKDFRNFYNWSISSGYSNGLTIDRIDVNGNYCPENCKWATIHEQTRNKRTNTLITIGKETKCLCDWAKHYCIRVNTVCDRIKRGWSIENALTIKPDKRFANKSV